MLAPKQYCRQLILKGAPHLPPCIFCKHSFAKIVFFRLTLWSQHCSQAANCQKLFAHTCKKTCQQLVSSKSLGAHGTWPQLGAVSRPDVPHTWPKIHLSSFVILSLFISAASHFFQENLHISALLPSELVQDTCSALLDFNIAFLYTVLGSQVFANSLWQNHFPMIW